MSTETEPPVNTPTPTPAPKRRKTRAGQNSAPGPTPQAVSPPRPPKSPPPPMLPADDDDLFDPPQPPTTVPPPMSPPPADDPFDPARFRLSQNFLTSAGVERHLTTVPVRKPTKEEWVRVHPSPDYALDTLLMELKDQRGEMYLIDPSMRDELATETTVGARRIVPVVNRQGTVFLWPLKLPAPDGRLDRWSESAWEAAEVGKSRWVRVQANMNLGAYEFSTTAVELPPPVWPAATFGELLRLAFRSNLIDSPDHIVVRQLRGQV